MEIKQNYSMNDVDFYLECYDEIKKEIDCFLVTPPPKSDGEKLNIIESKVGNKSEKELVKKMDDPWYKKRHYALKCVDRLYREMDDRTISVMKDRFQYNKYEDKLSLEDIGFKVNRSAKTVQRMINRQRHKLYRILNKNVPNVL